MGFQLLLEPLDFDDNNIQQESTTKLSGLPDQQTICDQL